MNTVETLFDYLSSGEKETKLRLLRGKCMDRERRDQVWYRETHISNLVAQALEGDELLYYQIWCEKRDEQTKNKGNGSDVLFEEQSKWFGGVTIPKMHRMEHRGWDTQVYGMDYVLANDWEDYTQQEIEDFLRENEEDNLRDYYYEEDRKLESGEYELSLRGKTAPKDKSHKRLQEKRENLIRGINTIKRFIAATVGHIHFLNRHRVTPLPEEYPDYKKLKILREQLQKAEKQLMRIELRLFSHETRKLVGNLLGPNVKVGNDIMTQKLYQIGLKMQDLESIFGHPNLNNKGFYGYKNVKKRYKRKNRENTHQAMEDNISYEINNDDPRGGQDEWTAFCGAQNGMGGIRADRTRNWFDIEAKVI